MSLRSFVLELNEMVLVLVLDAYRNTSTSNAGG